MVPKRESPRNTVGMAYICVSKISNCFPKAMVLNQCAVAR